MSLTLATQQVIAPITATGTTTPRSLQNRFADVVNVKDFGAVGDGTTDDTAAIQAACNYANTIRSSVYLDNGVYFISTAIIPAKSGVFGNGSYSTTILCNGCSAFTFPVAYLSTRQACFIQKLSIAPFNNTCNNLYAFYAKGVNANQSVQYNNGITITDITITNSFGGGFYFKDCFEINVDRIIMSAVGCPIVLVGSVIQSYFSNISAFGDNAPKNIGFIGFQTSVAQYNSFNAGPEHITTTDCSWINYDIGIYHAQGLFVNFINTDIQAISYGMILANPCIVNNSFIASMGTDTAGWIGIYTPTVNFQIENTITINSAIIQPLIKPNYPSLSYGIKIGNGIAEFRGIIIDKAIFKGNGVPNLQSAIYSTLSHGFNITNCMIDSSICIGNGFSFTNAYSAYIVGNSFGAAGGSIVLNNGTGGGDHGCISSNVVNGGSVTLTTGSPLNWLVQNNF
jgi:hypothetical protein